MIDLQPVQGARKAAERVAGLLVDHLHVALWDALKDGSAREARDYLIGATRAVNNNLANIAVLLHRYRQLRFAQDGDQTTLVRTTGVPYPRGDAPAARFAERELEMAAVVQGVFVNIGAALDCLAPVVVGIVGIGLDVHRVDFGSLLPRSDPTDYPDAVADKHLVRALSPTGDPLRELQLELLRGLANEVRAAGPEGWLTWALGMRNVWVHREHRTEFIAVVGDRRHRQMARLPPSNPDDSNIQALRLRGSKHLSGFYLQEDLLTTLDGLTASLDTTIRRTFGLIETALQARIEQPALIQSARLVWKTPPSRHSFQGYSPGSVQFELTRNVLMMNPGDVARLRAVDLLTE